jgi:hypothetical protein
MFFDPGTKREVKADPLSLDSLIAWLEKQPSGEPYCFMSNGHCLLAQYFAEVYGHPVWVGGSRYNPAGAGPAYTGPSLPADFNDVAYGRWFIQRGRVPSDTSRTFGGALNRARELRGAH